MDNVAVQYCCGTWAGRQAPAVPQLLRRMPALGSSTRITNRIATGPSIVLGKANNVQYFLDKEETAASWNLHDAYPVRTNYIARIAARAS